MATYNKRGHKPKTKPEKDAEVIEDSTTAEVFESLDQGANRTEEWVEKNQKAIFGVIVIILLVALGYLGYTKFIAEPQEIEAANELALAQENFTTALETTNFSVKDSLYNLALTGAQGKYGLIDIVDNYGGTAAGNLATYYAGMAYLETKDYQKAIEYLQDFDSDDMMLAPLAKGAIGDAFMQLDQAEDALEYYEQAAKMNVNNFTTPRFLFKAGVTATDLGKNEKAVKMLTRLKEEFPKSQYAAQADLFLGKAQAAN